MTTQKDPAGRVTVLGLGRMGSAMATRLAERGWTVTTWTRSGKTVPETTPVDNPVDAVKQSRIVLLALFDGPACRDVLGKIRTELGEGTVVVNTSTIGPDEAAAIAADARATGADYLHAPVLGSVGAVRSGALHILVGSSTEPGADLSALLADLGKSQLLGDAAAAAAAKLVANGVLGSALLAAGDARRAAAEAGLPGSAALEVLERTTLGGLVSGKKDRLTEGRFSDADFTTAALAKDAALLAAVAPSATALARRITSALESGAVDPDDDIAALAAVPATSESGDLARARLTLAADIVPSSPALRPLVQYALGHATGDSAQFREAFLPTAHVEGIRDGAFVSWSLDDYCALFNGEAAPDEATRGRRVDHLLVEGTVGSAAMTLWHGPDTFTDVFVLLQVDGEWRIANKVYSRA